MCPSSYQGPVPILIGQGDTQEDNTKDTPTMAVALPWAKCAECDNSVIKGVEIVCWRCTDPAINNTKKGKPKAKVTKEKAKKAKKCPPISKKVLRNVSAKTASSLRAYTEEWWKSGSPPRIETKEEYTEMWKEISRVFFVCQACNWAGQHVCALACWEGESY